ncbi:DUF4233 domain-containing protein [Glaciihabitans arcticus]|uniref:DUF4233 domain-containing protein n=1 Tax=Glaciihabitans arcticus TaxID=2668039 RepID=A0A4Q9GXP5_9MICO|nr:DUF4233 domain-containing protein [Glaciihabitans arcticus]TBN57050.1 DUF4233 domain-containing protein [Glaciihabitans arcticus]
MARVRVKRERSVSESLLSIVLALEALLIFFALLTAFGLRTAEPALAFGGGGALIVLLVLAGRLLMYPWGVWLGWALQLVIIATGILLPLMYVIGLGFLALWIFCFVRGRQIDAQKAEYLRNNPPINTEENNA